MTSTLLLLPPSSTAFVIDNSLMKSISPLQQQKVISHDVSRTCSRSMSMGINDFVGIRNTNNIIKNRKNVNQNNIMMMYSRENKFKLSAKRMDDLEKIIEPG